MKKCVVVFFFFVVFVCVSVLILSSPSVCSYFCNALHILRYCAVSKVTVVSLAKDSTTEALSHTSKREEAHSLLSVT